MKKLWPVFLILAAVAALRAQTNAPETSPAPPVAPAAAEATNALAPGATEKTNAARVRPPTHITSDHGEFLLSSNIYVYRGNVVVDDPQMKLLCDVLTVEAPRLPQGKFNRAVADGNVMIDWTENGQTNRAVAARAVYTYSITNIFTNALVVLTGPPNPVVTNEQGRIEGELIEWNRIKGSIYTKAPNTIVPSPGGGDVPDFFGGPSPAKTNAPRPKPLLAPK